MTKNVCTGWTGEYKWWGGVDARQTCQAWCMGLLSTRTKCIIKNTETTCQYVLLWAHEEQKLLGVSVFRVMPGKTLNPVALRYMEQVCVCVCNKPWRLKCDVLNLDLVGKGKPHSGALAQSQHNKAKHCLLGLCNITSMNLKIKL